LKLIECFDFICSILQNWCVNIVEHLFHDHIGAEETAVGVGTEVGVGTVGSSEAIMLAGLAFKRKWKT
jgi:glutamate decarboxylase